MVFLYATYQPPNSSPSLSKILFIMRFSSLWSLILSIGFSLNTVIAKDTLESVQKAFVQAGLVPDVLSSFNPILLLDVTYTIPDTNGEIKVVTPPGRNFTMPQTAIRPTWSIPSFDQGLAEETFVVAMVDPDAPTPQDPSMSQIRHFLGGDFKLEGQPTAEGLGATLVNRTPALSDYIQPSPPNNSDAHSLTTSVENFNISEFATQFKLGPPLAGNFMTLSTNPADLAAAGES
ncbi:hypothetical protein Clacol_007766 [Clathrus columnatus]|uniref:PEBP-like protein n=1 Tax=Clathrus columnatus TaxID=1419009 RepID=A0AAV5AIJ5_9AGAM|nr:hypothetical protein Clacol_007766 [Clathrus columnatus]